LSEEVLRGLRKISREEARRIHSYLKNRIEPLDDPRQLGKALRGAKLGNFWRYRVGDYRLICEILDQRLVVLVVVVGHRKDVYR
jgi:mRNA interferase RelE/StbE